MLRWRRCLRERTRMGTGSWTKRSGIGCSTLLAAEHPCEINNVLMMKMSFSIMLVKMTSKTIFVVVTRLCQTLLCSKNFCLFEIYIGDCCRLNRRGAHKKRQEHMERYRRKFFPCCTTKAFRAQLLM